MVMPALAPGERLRLVARVMGEGVGVGEVEDWVMVYTAKFDAVEKIERVGVLLIAGVEVVLEMYCTVKSPVVLVT